MILSKEVIPIGFFFNPFQISSNGRILLFPCKGNSRISMCYQERITSPLWQTSARRSYRCKMDGLLCHNNSTKIQQQSIESKTSTSQISELSFNKIQVHEKEIFKTDGLQSMNSSSQIQQQSTELKSSTSKISELSFDKLQIDEKEMCKGLKRAFGRFIAREVAVDEEYWTASWLRAEAHWEPMSYMRHVDNYKRIYAEQEFNALKRRCSGKDGNSLKCLCIVSVKKEDPNKRRTVLNSVVGTLDLSIRLLLHREKFPGENKRACSIPSTLNTNRYAYISNVCVSKFARRQGIATNMLHLAIDMASSTGMKQLFVHVNVDNRGAQELYRKVGFQVVDGSSQVSDDQKLLMCMDL